MSHQPLLEREDLLAALDERLRGAAAGRGSLVLVAGEAGAGKTSLVRTFAAAVDPATPILQGACDPLTTPRPLSPLHDFAAQPGLGLDDLMDDDRPAIERFVRVRDHLRSAARSTVAIVEDVHWADEATLDFLRFLGRRVAETRAVLIATYRHDEVGAEHPLRPVVGQLLPLPSTERLLVPPLSPEAVGALATATTPPASTSASGSAGAAPVIDPVDLHRVTGGNPFFVTEVLATGSTIPSTVQDAVLARVDTLDPEARRVVEAVSVAPRELEIDRAVGLANAAGEGADRAVASGVLVADGPRLRFRHELARAVIEDAVPPARRLDLHRRMLALLEGDGNRDGARLAHHAIRADVPELVVRYGPPAAREAAARGARREAIELYRAALRHREQLDADDEIGIRLALAVELRAVDRALDAADELRLVIERCRADVEENPDRVETLADALGQLHASLWAAQADRRTTGEAFDEALALLRPRGPSEMLALTLYRMAHSHMLARQRDPALAALAEADDVADQAGGPEVRWLTDLMIGCVDVATGRDDVAGRGLERIADSVVEAERMGNPRFVSMALGMLGSGGGETRLYERAIPALERGVAQGLATDEDYAVSYNRAWLARVAFEQGRWDETAELARLVEQTASHHSGIAGLTALSALGRTRVRRGDPGGVELLDEMIEVAADHELQHGWNAWCGRAEAHWLAGRPEAAAELLAPVLERALDTDSPWARGEIGFWMWRVGASDGPPPESASPFAAQMAGRWEEAADRWEVIGCPYEVALALADGDEVAQRRALAILDELGAVPAGRLVRQLLRDRGAEGVPRGPARSTRANPAGLTARQLDVLRLIAAGRSNAEIATELYVAKKTVEHHVSAVYAKLGVDSRTGAVAEARSRGIDLAI